MKILKMLKNYALGLMTFVAINLALTGCTEDVYNPNGGNKDVPNETEYPDFKTTADVNLNVDYELSDSKTLIEVYMEYPMQMTDGGVVVKTDKLPVFAAYTDEKGKFSGKMKLPLATSEIYLYTPTMGLPRCIGLDVIAGEVNFKYSDIYVDIEGTMTPTRANVESPEESNQYPYLLDRSKSLYSLNRWSDFGNQMRYYEYKSKNKYISNDTEANESWVKSIQRTLWNGKKEKPAGLDNSDRVADEKYINISIAESFMENGQLVKVDGAEIKLNFLDESGWYQNALGYYYYPTGTTPDVSNLKKYVIFPNVSTGGNVPFDRSKHDGYESHKSGDAPLKWRSEVVLKYTDGNGNVSSKFPAGYTIGWFIISDGFSCDNDDQLNTSNTFIYSNATWNKNNRKNCISLNDKKTGRVVIGFEDGGDKSYEDLLFYVQSNPVGAIIDPDRPDIDEGEGEDAPDKMEERTGTLAFEDVWPFGGDYDMNDVVMEYKHTVTFDANNKVKKIVDVFKPVHDGAKYSDAFAYQIDPAQVGAFAELPEGISYEAATHSFIVCQNTKEALATGREYVITRTFEGAASFDKALLKEYNPFVISNYVAGDTKRVEIHLPKHKATDYANKDLLFQYGDAYFIQKDGQFPFALDLPVLGFKVVMELSSIGLEGEYPSFTDWVKNGCGTVSANWYLHK